jgi:hypothetical protein
MPEVSLGGAPRFELATVAEWLKTLGSDGKGNQ